MGALRRAAARMRFGARGEATAAERFEPAPILRTQVKVPEVLRGMSDRMQPHEETPQQHQQQGQQKTAVSPVAEVGAFDSWSDWQERRNRLRPSFVQKKVKKISEKQLQNSQNESAKYVSTRERSETVKNERERKGKAAEQSERRKGWSEIPQKLSEGKLRKKNKIKNMVPRRVSKSITACAMIPEYEMIARTATRQLRSKTLPVKVHDEFVARLPAKQSHPIEVATLQLALASLIPDRSFGDLVAIDDASCGRKLAIVPSVVGQAYRHDWTAEAFELQFHNECANPRDKEAQLSTLLAMETPHESFLIQFVVGWANYVINNVELESADVETREALLQKLLSSLPRTIKMKWIGQYTSVLKCCNVLVDERCPSESIQSVRVLLDHLRLSFSNKNAPPDLEDSEKLLFRFPELSDAFLETVAAIERLTASEQDVEASVAAYASVLREFEQVLRSSIASQQSEDSTKEETTTKKETMTQEETKEEMTVEAKEPVEDQPATPSDAVEAALEEVQADSSEADPNEADSSEADSSEADPSEADSSEADSSEADPSEADSSEADSSEAVEPQQEESQEAFVPETTVVEEVQSETVAEEAKDESKVVEETDKPEPEKFGGFFSALKSLFR
ncbi:MAG: hypothetical protein MHM6MM_004799 [Cercozoa sp. M6MM]